MINSIHQIEITSRCNLRCRYCTHPKMQRAKIDMDPETYVRTLEWVEYFVQQGTQKELNLAGIGESTMHPDFGYYVRLAREAVGPRVRLVLATNGVTMTEELAAVLGEYDVHTWVSLHRPEKAGPAIEMIKKYGNLYGVSADPSVAAIDWAGQVDWHVSAPVGDNKCPWIYDHRVFVLSDGRVAQCCFDAEGVSVMGTVNDDLLAVKTGPYSLCSKCHLDSGVSVEVAA